MLHLIVTCQLKGPSLAQLSSSSSSSSGDEQLQGLAVMTMIQWIPFAQALGDLTLQCLLPPGLAALISGNPAALEISYRLYSSTH